MDKKSFKVLVAEDDETVRDMVTSFLSYEGYHVATACDGLDALKVLKSQDIDLVITDVIMPGADGIGVLKQAMKDCPEISVIIMSGHTTPDVTLEAMKEGAFDYIAKPFKIQDLLFIVEKAMLKKNNEELKRNLREIYFDNELMKMITGSNSPALIKKWVDRIEGFTASNVLTDEEAWVLRKKLSANNANRSPYLNL